MDCKAAAAACKFSKNSSCDGRPPSTMSVIACEQVGSGLKLEGEEHLNCQEDLDRKIFVLINKQIVYSP